MVAEPAGRWLIGVLLTLPLAAQAQTQARSPEPPDATPEVTTRPPSKDMLLYLTEFEDADGQWVDPLEVTREAESGTPDPRQEPEAAEPQS